MFALRTSRVLGLFFLRPLPLGRRRSGCAFTAATTIPATTITTRSLSKNRISLTGWGWCRRHRRRHIIITAAMPCSSRRPHFCFGRRCLMVAMVAIATRTY